MKVTFKLMTGHSMRSVYLLPATKVAQDNYIPNLKPCQTYRNINGGVKYLGHGFVLIL
jgi:hypothetical protein